MTAKNLLGQTLGPYTLESILGSGGMAVVYRAINAAGDAVALKVLFPPPGTETEILARFEREARTAARLNHPGIVRVIDVGHANDRAYLAMPLVEGDALTTRLAHSGKFDETTATDITWQIADALYYAHSQGVVHRDVKPSNILLTSEGHALLTDFGVAQALDDANLTRTGHTVGTPAYMAPEQTTGEADVDGRADLYSLGVVLYQMVTGRVPFEGSTPQILHAHVYNHPPAPSTVADVSPGVEAIILKAMAKDAAERFQNGAAMAEALNQLDDPAHAQISVTPTAHRWYQQPGLWVGIILLTAIAVIGGMWLSGSTSTDNTAQVTATQHIDTPSPPPTLAPQVVPVTPTVSFATGSLLRGTGDGIFRVHADGSLQHVYDWLTFQHLGFNTDDIITVEDSAMAGLPREEITRLLESSTGSLDWAVDGERWRIDRWQPILAQSGYMQLPAGKTDADLLAALPLTLTAKDLPEDTLVKIGDNFYRLFSGHVLRRFTEPDLIYEYNYAPDKFVDIPDEVSHLYPNGAPLTPLLQSEDNDDIYLITDGQRSLMPPISDELWALGYALEDISKVPPDFLQEFPATGAYATTQPTPPATDEPEPEQTQATPCPQPMDESFTALTHIPLDELLGCPRTDSVTTPGAWQPFEHGLMLWRQDSNLIYGVGPNEAWFITGDRWVDGDDPYDPAIIAPDGYYQPGRGFGKVWQERPGVRAALGWALANEISITATIQDFTEGQVWHDSQFNRFMILYNSGEYQIIQGGETVDRS